MRDVRSELTALVKTHGIVPQFAFLAESPVMLRCLFWDHFWSTLPGLGSLFSFAFLVQEAVLEMMCLFHFKRKKVVGG